MGFIICAAVAAVIAVILLLPVDSAAELWYIENEGGGEFFIKIAGIRLKLPQKKKEEKKEEAPAEDEPEEESGSLLPGLGEIKNLWEGLRTPAGKLWRFLLRRGVRIKNIELEIDYGLDDPMDTGMLNGFLNGAVYSGLSAVCRHMTVSAWNIRITPDFDNKKVNIRFLCILRTRIVHIINIGARILIIAVKYTKLSKRKDEENG